MYVTDLVFAFVILKGRYWNYIPFPWESNWYLYHCYLRLQYLSYMMILKFSSFNLFSRFDSHIYNLYFEIFVDSVSICCQLSNDCLVLPSSSPRHHNLLSLVPLYTTYHIHQRPEKYPVSPPEINIIHPLQSSWD